MAILAAIADGETVESAAAKGDIGATTFWNRRQADPEFAAAYEVAKLQGKRKRTAQLTKVLYEGAGKASEDPRFTTQLIFALKNIAPQEFRDVHEISGPGGGAIPLQVVMFGQPVEREPDQIETPGTAAAGA